MLNLRDVFSKRADMLTDHDPWRYGEELSLKGDMIELGWVLSSMNHGSLLDMGCGTGRHCIELAKKFPNLQFECFDFADNNIAILKKKIEEEGLANIHPKVCGTAEMAQEYTGKTFDNLLSIGLIQYLDDDELRQHMEDCHRLLSKNGIHMVKHPTAHDETFVFDGYSELLQSRYVSKYRNYNDVAAIVSPFFEIEKYDPVFTLEHLSQEELDVIEQSSKSQQMWFLLRKKE